MRIGVGPQGIGNPVRTLLYPGGSRGRLRRARSYLERKGFPLRARARGMERRQRSQERGAGSAVMAWLRPGSLRVSRAVHLSSTRARESSRGVMLPPAACRLEGAGEPGRRRPASSGPWREAWRVARSMGNRRRPVLTLRYPGAPPAVYARRGPTGGGRTPLLARPHVIYGWGGKPRQRGNRQRTVGPANLPSRGEVDRYVGYSARGRRRVDRAPQVGQSGHARSDRENPPNRAGDERRSAEPPPLRIALPAPPRGPAGNAAQWRLARASCRRVPRTIATSRSRTRRCSPAQKRTLAASIVGPGSSVKARIISSSLRSCTARFSASRLQPERGFFR